MSNYPFVVTDDDWIWNTNGSCWPAQGLAKPPLKQYYDNTCKTMLGPLAELQDSKHCPIMGGKKLKCKVAYPNVNELMKCARVGASSKHKSKYGGIATCHRKFNARYASDPVYLDYIDRVIGEAIRRKENPTSYSAIATYKKNDPAGYEIRLGAHCCGDPGAYKTRPCFDYWAKSPDLHCTGKAMQFCSGHFDATTNITKFCDKKALTVDVNSTKDEKSGYNDYMNKLAVRCSANKDSMYSDRCYNMFMDYNTVNYAKDAKRTVDNAWNKHCNTVMSTPATRAAASKVDLARCACYKKPDPILQQYATKPECWITKCRNPSAESDPKMRAYQYSDIIFASKNPRCPPIQLCQTIINAEAGNMAVIDNIHIIQDCFNGDDSKSTKDQTREQVKKMITHDLNEAILWLKQGAVLVDVIIASPVEHEHEIDDYTTYKQTMDTNLNSYSYLDSSFMTETNVAKKYLTDSVSTSKTKYTSIMSVEFKTSSQYTTLRDDFTNSITPVRSGTQALIEVIKSTGQSIIDYKQEILSLTTQAEQHLTSITSSKENLRNELDDIKNTPMDMSVFRTKISDFIAKCDDAHKENTDTDTLEQVRNRVRGLNSYVKGGMLSDAVVSEKYKNIILPLIDGKDIMKMTSMARLKTLDIKLKALKIELDSPKTPVKEITDPTTPTTPTTPTDPTTTPTTDTTDTTDPTTTPTTTKIKDYGKGLVTDTVDSIKKPLKFIAKQTWVINLILSIVIIFIVLLFVGGLGVIILKKPKANAKIISSNINSSKINSSKIKNKRKTKKKS